MSILKTVKIKLGNSLSAINNFLFDASAQNGTMKLERENGQEVMKFLSNGKPEFAQLVKTFGTNGSFELPNGLIVKWGRLVTGWGTNNAVTFPVQFPNACVFGCASVQNGSQAVAASTGISQTTITIFQGAATNQDTVWFAIGY